MEINVKKLNEIVKQQFRENSYKNLFCTTGEQFRFHAAAVRAIQLLGGQSYVLTNDDKTALLPYYATEFVRTFYKTDPYINFNKRDIYLIKQIYLLMLNDINQETALEEIQKNHYDRIRRFIKYSNPAIYKINHNSSIKAKHFVCAEYTCAFQLDLLEIEREFLIEPILDIGCGEHGNLVRYFRSQNLEAYGIDCLKEESRYFYSGNWLEFSYGFERWGTIFSHLSFSGHFLHHFLQNDGLDVLYAKTYMRILDSLVPGGSWIYTPSVPFMEDLLLPEKYCVSRKLIGADIYKTVISRR